MTDPLMTGRLLALLHSVDTPAVRNAIDRLQRPEAPMQGRRARTGSDFAAFDAARTGVENART